MGTVRGVPGGLKCFLCRVPKEIDSEVRTTVLQNLIQEPGEAGWRVGRVLGRVESDPSLTGLTPRNVQKGNE